MAREAMAGRFQFFFFILPPREPASCSIIESSPHLFYQMSKNARDGTWLNDGGGEKKKNEEEKECKNRGELENIKWKNKTMKRRSSLENYGSVRFTVN